MAELNINALECCLAEMPRYGVKPTAEQLRPILETDEYLVNILNEYYADNSTHYGLDTMEREMVSDVVSKHFTGRETPCYGDGPEYARDFYNEFLSSANKSGWEVISE